MKVTDGTIKCLKYVKPFLLLFKSSVWPEHKKKSSWSRATNYFNLNQVVTPTTAAIQSSQFSGTINIISSTWYTTMALVNTFSPIPINREQQKISQLLPGRYSTLPPSYTVKGTLTFQICVRIYFQGHGSFHHATGHHTYDTNDDSMIRGL